MRRKTSKADQVRIQQLEEELYEARNDLLELMQPYEVVSLLQSGTDCKSLDDFHRWKTDTTEKILALAKPDPEATSPYSFSERAYCPLCKQGSTAPHEKGFAVPISLERHLRGYGNMNSCVVFNAAHKMALQHLRRRAEDPVYRDFMDTLDRFGTNADDEG